MPATSCRAFRVAETKLVKRRRKLVSAPADIFDRRAHKLNPVVFSTFKRGFVTTTPLTEMRPLYKRQGSAFGYATPVNFNIRHQEYKIVGIIAPPKSRCARSSPVSLHSSSKCKIVLREYVDTPCLLSRGSAYACRIVHDTNASMAAIANSGR